MLCLADGMFMSDKTGRGLFGGDGGEEAPCGGFGEGGAGRGKDDEATDGVHLRLVVFEKGAVAVEFGWDR